MNKVILLGRIARDIETSTTSSGKLVARTAIAVNRRMARRQEAQAAGQQTADFIPLVFWEQRAEFAQHYLLKGRQILVEGRLQVRQFEDQQGQRRSFTEVVVDNTEFADSKPQGSSGSSYGTPPAGRDGFSGQGRGAAVDAPPPFASPMDDEEVPF